MTEKHYGGATVGDLLKKIISQKFPGYEPMTTFEPGFLDQEITPENKANIVTVVLLRYEEAEEGKESDFLEALAEEIAAWRLSQRKTKEYYEIVPSKLILDFLDL